MEQADLALAMQVETAEVIGEPAEIVARRETAGIEHPEREVEREQVAIHVEPARDERPGEQRDHHGPAGKDNALQESVGLAPGRLDGAHRIVAFSASQKAPSRQGNRATGAP